MGDERANYCFASVFHHCPDRKKVCLNSFITVGREHWEKSFELCEDDGERTAFYAIRAFLKGGFAVEEMENIFKIDPASPYLEVLLARQINKLERRMYPRYFDFDYEDGYNYQPPTKYPAYPRQNEEREMVKRLGQLTEKIAALSGDTRRDFWINAQASLATLTGDYDQSQQLAGTISENSVLYKNAVLTGFVARLCQLDKADAEIENEIGALYNKHPFLHKHKDFNGLLWNVFSLLYNRSHQVGKHYLCHNNLAAMKQACSLEIIESLQTSYGDGTGLTSFEKIMFERAGVNNPGQLIEARGNYFLNNNQLYGALAAYSKISEDYKEESYLLNKSKMAKILAETKISEHNSPGYLEKNLSQELKLFKKVTNKKELVQTLLDFDIMINQATDDKQRSQYLYLKTCIWNNANQFRAVLDSSRIFAACERIASFSDVDRELQARACFMAADRADYPLPDNDWKTVRYWNPDIKNFDGTKGDSTARDEHFYVKSDQQKNLRYFDLLKNQFSDTEYYKEAIEECALMRVYIKG